MPARCWPMWAFARAIVPRYPGVTSAMGCVIADMRQDFVQTINALVDGLDEARCGGVHAIAYGAGLAMLDAAQTRFEAREVSVRAGHGLCRADAYRVRAAAA